MERMISFAFTGKYYLMECPDTLSTDNTCSKYEPEGDLATMESQPLNEKLTTKIRHVASCSTIGSSDGLSAAEKWVAHARIYGLADYYDMPHLRSHALERFKEVTDSIDDSDPLEGFIDVVNEVCKRTVRERDPMRDALLEIVLLYAPILVSSDKFITALGERESLGDFAADMFGNLGRYMLAEIAKRDERTLALQVEMENLDEAMKVEQRGHSVQLAAAQAKLTYTEGVMDRLVKSLEALPARCRKFGCNATFGRLSSERQGNMFEGYRDWQVRCGNRDCGHKLHI